MAQKIKLTRPELKRRRDRLARFERYLPMLKLKQQQLQMTLREVGAQVRRAQQALDEVAAKLSRYRSVLADRAGIPLEKWSRPERVRTSQRNIAGVEMMLGRNLNAYGILRAEVILFTKEGLSSLEGVFAQ